MVEIKGKHNTAKVFTDEIEQGARDQIQALCDCEAFRDSKIRMMPDVHAGKGCCIGTTMTLTDRVVPGLVGVDIGCGMLARKISNSFVDFDLLEKVIRAEVPSGRNVRDEKLYAPEDLKDALLSLRCLKAIDMDYALRSLGTLGGGNHFIEVDRGSDSFWIVIHSGSRHLGLEIAEYYQDIAHEMCNTVPGLIRDRIAQLKAEGRHKDIQSEIERIKRENLHEPGDLDYVSGSAFSDYIHDMRVAQKYAMYNRWSMMAIICHSMHFDVTDEFETVHNYIDTDAMILRKGSVSAKEGERILIPMNMRDGSLICTGKGNPDWNFSAPHGAGRLMSRTQAKKLSMDDYRDSMQGIWSASISEETLDECPMAYKSMESIMSNIRDTADVKEIIKPVYNYKAKE